VALNTATTENSAEYIYFLFMLHCVITSCNIKNTVQKATASE